MLRTVLLTSFLSIVLGVATAAQFRVEDYALPWLSANGLSALVLANAPTNGWTGMTRISGGVCFIASTSGVPTPLWTGDGATGSVAYAALVVDCTGEPSSWATLLDAPFPVRLGPRAYPWQSLDFATNGVSIVVDLASDSELPTMPMDGARHLVEASFPEAVAMSEVFIGGHPATPAWNRPWPGRIYEAVLLEAVPHGKCAAALRAYLSIKWGLGLEVPSPPNARQTLLEIGVKSDPLFSSVLLAR